MNRDFAFSAPINKISLETGLTRPYRIKSGTESLTGLL